MSYSFFYYRKCLTFNLVYVILYIENEKGIKKMKLIQNIECGNIFDITEQGLRELREEASELYDLNDETNLMNLWDYYKVIEVF